MKVKEANDSLEKLQILSNNIRLLNQYFLHNSERDKEITEITGISRSPSVNETLYDALVVISKVASKYENAILEAEISELNIQ